MQILTPSLLLIGAVICTENVSQIKEELASATEQATELVREEITFRKPAYNGTEFAGEVFPENATCDKLSSKRSFAYTWDKKCPIDYNILEIDGRLYDPNGIIRFSCHKFRPMEFLENKVYTLTSSQLLTYLNSPPKDQYKRSWCMITFFYSPKCVFSKELAPTINAIPHNYPTIVTVAVDASSFSRLNTRYGIAGTPTLILWVNGVPISRMDDKPLNTTGLNEYLNEWTDVESLHASTGEEYPISIKHAPIQEQWETPAAVFTLILAAIYYWRSWVLQQTAVSGALRCLGTTPEAVGAFLNGM